jgi:SAM-dependent methyltransferase
MRTRRSAVVAASLAIAWSTLTWAQSPEAEAKQDAADIARLVEVLQVRAGTSIADVGTAGGRLSLLLSPIVGPSGRVFATDVNKDRIAEIHAAVARAGVSNITVVEGDPNRTNLPDACCEAIFMRHVYHHFGDPSRMNQSLYQGLKAGGRLAIADFAPTAKRSAPPGKRNDGDVHGVMPETVIEELTAAGFANARQESWSHPSGFLVVAEKKR